MSQLVADVPAICDDCQQVFATALSLEDTAELRLIGDLRARPCPRCGGTGRIPNGSYTIINGVLTVSPEHASREDMLRAAEILQDALSASSAPELEPIEEALRQHAPSAADWILKVLRDPAWGGVGAIAGTIAGIIAALALAVAMRQGEPGPPSPHAPAGGTPTTTPVRGEPGRNSMCPCGSGKKYKRCHGAPTSSREHPDHPDHHSTP